MPGAGVSLVALDGTLYDQVLDWVVYLGLEPERFQVGSPARSLRPLPRWPGCRQGLQPTRPSLLLVKPM